MQIDQNMKMNLFLGIKAATRFKTVGNCTQQW